MSDLCETIYQFEKPWTVISLALNQDESKSNRALEIVLAKEEERIKLRLEAPDEIDSIGELMDADTIWIEKEKNSQKEFGTIRLEAISEYTTTIHFDSIREIE